MSVNSEQITVNNNEETKGELLGIAESTLAKVAAAGALGAVSVSKSQTDELTLESGEFSLLRTTYNSSLSLRALIPEGELGNRKGSYSTNSLDASAVDTAVSAAIAAARSSEPDTAEIIAPGFGERDFEADFVPLDLEALYARITEFLAAVDAEFPKVKILQLIAKYNSGASLLANSNGTRGFITYGYYSLSIEYSGRDGDNTTGFGYTGFNTIDVENPIMERAEVRRLLSEAEAQLSPKPVEGKFDGKLLVAPGCLDNFLHYAIYLGTSDSALIEKQSPWLGKLNTKVADDKLTVTANPLHKSIIAAGHFNTDGYILEPQPIIERGTLIRYQLSQYGALKTGNERAKATNSYIIEPGNTPLAELIASIDDGVLINQFSGGSPSPAGDFSGVAKMSFRIKNGKIAEALTETMISGNLFAMLQNIDGISSETVEDGGGSTPWIIFGGITVS